jgi:hygromycin-B 7''-O-kinase
MGTQGSALAEVRARRALTDAQLDPTVPLERASSVTNEVWLTEDHVIRVNRQPNSRLQREGELAPLLPPQVGYPRIVAQGGQPGKDWMIVERVAGQPLARCWPTMTERDRHDAVRDVASMLRAVHATQEPPGLLPSPASPQLLGLDGERAVDTLLPALQRARSLPNVDAGVIQTAILFVTERAHLLEPFQTHTLVHGDLTFENVLWHEGRVVALLDFEWSRRVPPDIDLDILLRFCALPFLHVAPDYEHLARPDDYRLVPWWFRDSYPELFEFPAQLDRMRMYSLAYDVRELLAHPPRVHPDELSPYHPYARMRNVVEGRSYLDELRRS